eukprot:5915703-Prymnesium_polylepis.2
MRHSTLAPTPKRKTSRFLSRFFDVAKHALNEASSASGSAVMGQGARVVKHGCTSSNASDSDGHQWR